MWPSQYLIQTSVPMEIDLYGFAPIPGPNYSYFNPFQRQCQQQQHQQHQQQPNVDLAICKCILSAQKNKSLQQNEKNMYSVQHLQELCNMYNIILSDPSKTIQIDVFFNALNTNKLITCVANNVFTINL